MSWHGLRASRLVAIFAAFVRLPKHVTRITAPCSGLALYCDIESFRGGEVHRTDDPYGSSEETGMAACPFEVEEAQRPIGQGWRVSADARSSGKGRMEQEAVRAYRGSWAEQMVVARLATKSRAKATRMTTTPPTVSRSQKSEVLLTSNSRFPVITDLLMHHSTEAVGDCSDQDHRHAVCQSRLQMKRKCSTHFELRFQERRLA